MNEQNNCEAAKVGKVTEAAEAQGGVVGYKLKTPAFVREAVEGSRQVVSESGVADAYQAIESGVVGAYKGIEGAAVGAYKAIETTVVDAYKAIEGKFVDAFLEPVDKQDGEKQD